MRIVLVQLFELPSEMAHAIQIVSTAGALAERGHEVVLHVRCAEHAAAVAAACEILGAPLPAGLTIAPARARHKGLAGLGYRSRLAASLWRDPETRFYARQRRQTLSVLALRRALGRRATVVYEFHNIEHVVAREAGNAARANRVRAEEQRLAHAADGLVAISDPLADDLVTAFELAQRPQVIPDGVDLTRFRGVARPFESAQDAVRAVYAGSLYAHKGVERLVECIPHLPQHVALTIVGGHPQNELDRLRARVHELALDARVTFAGQRTPSGVAEELARADLILLPAADEARSQRYTSPLKLFEAMATGAPIVAAPSPAYTSVLTDDSAFLASSNTPQGLADAVARALENPQRARAIGHAAQAAAEAYGWNERARRIEDVLAAAAERRQAAFS